MGTIIADTYEIIREIGSGGAGVVYLGKHLRLKKEVVLKADKRSLRAKTETLRREVDALKNLSHRYIPQVYDFVAQRDTVYTVMDYIEGESLDKLLVRGELPSQRQVVEWACQLLEALCYLHSRPPHGILHADIKPANVMITPENTVCLIDFNIALALGESGSVSVGYSIGYASPEHYRAENSDTELTQDASIHPRVLDVRSDVYMLGATLYHALTGRRAPRRAEDVPRITTPGVSPPLAAIVAKAMAPDPDQRYQTAAEMLDAFARLHRDDPRTRRHRLCMRVTATALAVLFAGGAASSFWGLRQLEHEQAAARVLSEQAEAAERLRREALAAVTDAEEALRCGDADRAAALAASALSLGEPASAPRAQTVLTAALGVYDVFEGFRAERVVPLPGAPISLTLAPNGRRLAVVCNGKVLAINTDTGEIAASLEAAPMARADVVWTGADTLLYAGAEGVTAYDAAAGDVLWTGAPASELTLTADESTVCAVDSKGAAAVLYRVADGSALRTVDFDGLQRQAVVNDLFADSGRQLLALRSDAGVLAASFPGGTLKLFDLESSDTVTLYDSSEFTGFSGGFFGDCFAYTAYTPVNSGSSAFAVVDTAAWLQTGGFQGILPYLIQADAEGVRLAQENVIVTIDPVTGEQQPAANTDSDVTAFVSRGGYTVAACKDGTLSAFDSEAEPLGALEGRADFLLLADGVVAAATRDAQEVRLCRLTTPESMPLFTYDADWPHEEARVSADGETLTLFQFDSFRIYGREGVRAEVRIPDAGDVYDVQYRRDGSNSYLEVLYNSGLRRTYSAADGHQTGEEAGEAPDGSLDETYLTDELRIESPLHGEPAAYDRETGELIRTLGSDDYLAYVTQAGEYLVAQYITSQFEHYGVLMNRQCETLARLPNLCDVTADGKLFFDNDRGEIRESHIWNTSELLELAGV